MPLQENLYYRIIYTFLGFCVVGSVISRSVVYI